MVTREFRRTRLFSGTESVNIRDLERSNFKVIDENVFITELSPSIVVLVLFPQEMQNFRGNLIFFSWYAKTIVVYRQ